MPIVIGMRCVGRGILATLEIVTSRRLETCSETQDGCDGVQAPAKMLPFLELDVIVASQECKPSQAWVVKCLDSVIRCSGVSGLP